MSEHGPSRGGKRSTGDQVALDFLAWAGEERIVAAVRSLGRRRALERQAGETAGLQGVLLDLAERSTPVRLSFAGTEVVGRLAGVARDFVVIIDRAGLSTLISTSHLDSISPAGDSPRIGTYTVDDDRPAPLDLDLRTALVMLATERSPVHLVTITGASLSGDVLAAGEELLTVSDSHHRKGPSYDKLAAIASCTPI